MHRRCLAWITPGASEAHTSGCYFATVVRILSVEPALPDYPHDQREITDQLVDGLATDDTMAEVIRRIHRSTGVDTRHLVMPIEQYRGIESFTQANTLFREHALALSATAVTGALAKAGIAASEVDYLFFTTVTGVGAPSLDVELVTQLGFRTDVVRVPSFGLGCVAGASAIARVADYLRGHPRAIGLVVSVELCSLTIQWDDPSMANIVGTGLFGDGAAAVVMVGQDSPHTGGIRVTASRSAVYPESSEAIGWRIGSTGFRLMLSPAVPNLIDQHLAGDIDALLGDNGLERADIGTWIAHPGGPRVLEAFSEALDLAPADLAMSWQVMGEVGNLSSSAVLHVLARCLERPSGHKALLFALGPGVSVEIVLLEWP